MGKAGIHDDVKVLQELKLGDEMAFKSLFQKYSGRLYNVAYGYLGNREETLEIVQEAFIKVWLNHQSIQPDLPFIPYLVRISKNLIINKAKRKLVEMAYLNTLETGPFVANFSTENQVLFSEVNGLVNQIINVFPEKRKEIFTLSRKKGLTNQEIATRLKISESTVENQINKALKTLRSALKKAGYTVALIIPFIILF